MVTRSDSIRVLVFVLAGLCSTALMIGDDSERTNGPGGYYYYFFKERQQLSLDTERVLVLERADQGGVARIPELAPT